MHETLETDTQAEFAALVWELLADQVSFDDDLQRLYKAEGRVELTISGMRDAGALAQDVADQIMRDEY